MLLVQKLLSDSTAAETLVPTRNFSLRRDYYDIARENYDNKLIKKQGSHTVHGSVFDHNSHGDIPIDHFSRNDAHGYPPVHVHPLILRSFPEMTPQDMLKRSLEIPPQPFHGFGTPHSLEYDIELIPEPPLSKSLFNSKSRNIEMSRNLVGPAPLLFSQAQEPLNDIPTMYRHHTEVKQLNGGKSLKMDAPVHYFDDTTKEKNKKKFETQYPTLAFRKSKIQGSSGDRLSKTQSKKSKKVSKCTFNHDRLLKIHIINTYIDGILLHKI